MSDSECAVPPESAVPATCQIIKADLDKCIKDKGESACKKLMEAFTTCVKNNTAAS